MSNVVSLDEHRRKKNPPLLFLDEIIIVPHWVDISNAISRQLLLEFLYEVERAKRQHLTLIVTDPE